MSVSHMFALNKLREIKETLPENTILFTFDVEKLYPSVRREEGLAGKLWKKGLIRLYLQSQWWKW